MFKCARIYWALIMLCAFASAAGAQVTAPTANQFPVETGIVDQADKGSMQDNIYLAFDPDTVVNFGITVVVIDSAVSGGDAASMIIDVTGRWKGAIHTERDTTRIDAEYIFPHTAGGDGGFPDSVFYLTWDKPGDEDRYTYQSHRQMHNRYNGGGALIGIDILHYHNHKGNVYTAYADSVLAGANDSLEIAIITPADRNIHVWWEADVDAKGWFYIKTGSTLGVTADTLTAHNSNHQSSNTSSAVLIKAPRTAATGTIIRVKLIGSTQKAGGNMIAHLGMVLEKSTTYVFGFASTAATDGTVILRWKETKD